MVKRVNPTTLISWYLWYSTGEKLKQDSPLSSSVAYMDWSYGAGHQVSLVGGARGPGSRWVSKITRCKLISPGRNNTSKCVTLLHWRGGRTYIKLARAGQNVRRYSGRSRISPPLFFSDGLKFEFSKGSREHTLWSHGFTPRVYLDP